MKTLLLLLISFFCIQTARSQVDSLSPKTNTLDILMAPQTEANYPGGIKKLKKFLQENIDPGLYEAYYSSLSRPKKGMLEIVSARIESDVDLVIDKDGKLYNIDIKKKFQPFVKKEIIRQLLLSQPWNPATQNNLAVKSRKTINIEFFLVFTAAFRRHYFSLHPEYH